MAKWEGLCPRRPRRPRRPKRGPYLSKRRRISIHVAPPPSPDRVVGVDYVPNSDDDDEDDDEEEEAWVPIPVSFTPCPANAPEVFGEGKDRSQPENCETDQPPRTPPTTMTCDEEEVVVGEDRLPVKVPDCSIHKEDATIEYCLRLQDSWERTHPTIPLPLFLRVFFRRLRQEQQGRYSSIVAENAKDRRFFTFDDENRGDEVNMGSTTVFEGWEEVTRNARQRRRAIEDYDDDDDDEEKEKEKEGDGGEEEGEEQQQQQEEEQPHATTRMRISQCKIRSGSCPNRKGGVVDPFERQQVARWSSARLKAWQERYKSPNAFYYRFPDPGQMQWMGDLTVEEERLWIERYDEFKASHWHVGNGWGLFSIPLVHRVGYQCSNYYRRLLQLGKLTDPSYGYDEKGDLRQIRPDTIAPGEGPIPEEYNQLSAVWSTPSVKQIEAQVNEFIREFFPGQNTGDVVPRAVFVNHRRGRRGRTGRKKMGTSGADAVPDSMENTHKRRRLHRLGHERGTNWAVTEIGANDDDDDDDDDVVLARPRSPSPFPPPPPPPLPRRRRCQFRRTGCIPSPVRVQRLQRVIDTLVARHDRPRSNPITVDRPPRRYRGRKRSRPRRMGRRRPLEVIDVDQPIAPPPLSGNDGAARLLSSLQLETTKSQATVTLSSLQARGGTLPQASGAVIRSSVPSDARLTPLGASITDLTNTSAHDPSTLSAYSVVMGHALLLETDILDHLHHLFLCVKSHLLSIEIQEHDLVCDLDAFYDFLKAYIRQRIPNMTCDQRLAFRRALSDEISGMERYLGPLSPSTNTSSPTLLSMHARHRAHVLDWLFLWEQHGFTEEDGEGVTLRSFARELMQQLLVALANFPTMLNLTFLANRDHTVTEQPLLSLWHKLIYILDKNAECQRRAQHPDRTPSFWSMLNEILLDVTMVPGASSSSQDNPPSSSMHDVVEFSWEALLRIAPLYFFRADGNATAKLPLRPANWLLVDDLLKRSPVLTEGVDHSFLSSREEYVCEVLGRCLGLSQVWPSDVDTVYSVWEIVRRSTCHASRGYPTFLTNFHGTVPHHRERGDAPLDVFLKMLHLHLCSVCAQPVQLNRIASRFFITLPSSSVIIREDMVPTDELKLTYSRLRSFFGMVLTFATLLPVTQHKTVIQRLFSLFNFKESDDVSREVFLEGLFILCLILQEKDSNLTELGNRISDLLDTLCAEYLGERGKERISLAPIFIADPSAAKKGTEGRLEELIKFSLDAIRFVFDHRRGHLHCGEYTLIGPFLAMVLNAALPFRGSIRHVALDIVRAALHPRDPAGDGLPSARDEEGSIHEMNFSDEGWDVLLTDDVIETMIQEHNRQKEEEGAETIRARQMDAALWERTSKHAVPLLGGLVAGRYRKDPVDSASKRYRIDRSLLEDALDCLACVAIFSVLSGDKTWDHFFATYGPNSFWITHDSGQQEQRQVPLVFCHRLLTRYPAAVDHQPHTFLHMWILSMLEVTVPTLVGDSVFVLATLQRDFTRLLMQASSTTHFFSGVPDTFVATPTEFLRNKLSMLKAVFGTIGHMRCSEQKGILVTKAQLADLFTYIPTVINRCYREVMGRGRVEEEYSVFVYSVLGALLRHCSEILYDPTTWDNTFVLILTYFFLPSNSPDNHSSGTPAMSQLQHVLVGIAQLDIERDASVAEIMARFFHTYLETISGDPAHRRIDCQKMEGIVAGLTDEAPDVLGGSISERVRLLRRFVLLSFVSKYLRLPKSRPAAIGLAHLAFSLAESMVKKLADTVLVREMSVLFVPLLDSCFESSVEAPSCVVKADFYSFLVVLQTSLKDEDLDQLNPFFHAAAALMMQDLATLSGHSVSVDNLVSDTFEVQRARVVSQFRVHPPTLETGSPMSSRAVIGYFTEQNIPKLQRTLGRNILQFAHVLFRTGSMGHELALQYLPSIHWMVASSPRGQRFVREYEILLMDLGIIGIPYRRTLRSSSDDPDTTAYESPWNIPL